MNQEQNNLNPNNFNTQGNNGIPNNQPLNNQSFNQGMSVNQQTINSQPKPTPSYEQPIMQDSTPQPINKFESGDTNNENLNDKSPKKMNFGLIIGIVAAVAVVAVIAVLLIGKSNSSGSSNSLFDSNAEKITEEQIKSYNLTSIVRWGNYNLGVSYLIPNISTAADGTYSSPHGHHFNLGEYEIYVEKSLDGYTNLYTLPEDINREKDSYKYKLEYGHMGSNSVDFSIETTKEIKIHNIDAVYFESVISSETYMENIDEQYIGYSFEYNKQYISVYAQYYIDKENRTYHSNKSEINEILQYIVSSFNTYDGESFYELDNNFNLKELYNDGRTNKDVDELIGDERQFMFNEMDCGTSCNYVLLSDIDAQKIEWDGNYNTIFTAIQTNNEEFKKINGLHFGTDGLLSKFKILEEKKEVINGINMQKYTIYDQFVGNFNYIVLYTFVIDGNPYIYSFYYNGHLEEEGYDEQQKQVLKEWVDINASTMIRTLRFISFEENSTNNSFKYLDYIR